MYLRWNRFMSIPSLILSSVISSLVMLPTSVVFAVELDKSQIEIIKRDLIMIGISHPEFDDFTVIDVIADGEKLLVCGTFTIKSTGKISHNFYGSLNSKNAEFNGTTLSSAVFGAVCDHDGFITK